MGGNDRHANRVPVIEDAETISVAVQSALTEAGHAVLTRPDGRELERDLREFRPDVVILDVMLRRLPHGRPAHPR